MSLNIWLVTLGEPLPLQSGIRKMRTAMVADVLLHRGHRVTWWTSAYDHQRKKMLFPGDAVAEVAEGMSVRALKGIGYVENLSIRRYVDHKLIARKFRKQVKRVSRPDVVIVSMPCHNLAYEVAKYAVDEAVPLVVDVRDLWPDIIVKSFSGISKHVVSLMLIRDFYRLRYTMRHADALFAVSKGYLSWALNYAQRDQSSFDRVYYHGYNARSPDKTGVRMRFRELLDSCSGYKVFSFVGTFGRSYDLETVIEAARLFHEQGNRAVKFILAGDGEKSEALRERARDLSNVEFPGWLCAEEIRLLLSTSHVGLVPCDSVIDTMPNKPFEYLSAGLPLLSSLEGEMAQLIQEQGIGVNYACGDVSGLHRSLLKFMDEKFHCECRSNAAAIFDRAFNAGHIYRRYADDVEEIASTRSGRAGILHETSV